MQSKIRFLFILPAVLWIAAFTIFPLVYSLRLSFFSWYLGQGIPEFVALANYVRAFSDAKFWNALEVTLLFATITLSVEMILGLGLALLMNQEVRGKRHFRTILTLPLFVTPVALGYLGITIFFEEGILIKLRITSGYNTICPWTQQPRP